MPKRFESLPVAVFNDPGGRPPRHVGKAQRIQDNADLQTFRYRVAARMRADYDRADSHAAHDAYRAALERELELLAWGVRQAGMSVAALELVASKVAGLKAANDDRLNRRFGS